LIVLMLSFSDGRHGALTHAWRTIRIRIVPANGHFELVG